MITHIVLFKFKETTTQAEIAECFRRLAILKTQLPGILFYQYASYRSQEGLNQGFTHGFIMKFASEAERDAYLVDPKHIDVATFIQQYLNFSEGVIAFDGKFTQPSLATSQTLCMGYQTPKQPSAPGVAGARPKL